jgi:predicted DNA-binding transcriptional regulator AlpA
MTCRPSRLAHVGQRGYNGGDAPVSFVTIEEFAQIAHLSRRQIDRLRKRRPTGFPREYELGNSLCKYRRCPRFKLADVLAWMETRALW